MIFIIYPNFAIMGGADKYSFYGVVVTFIFFMLLRVSLALNSQCATCYYILQITSTMDRTKRCSYKKITEEVRLDIIDRILQKGENIKEVAQEMNVNISTCKAILKVFQEEGRIGKKKKRNKVYNVIETFSFFTINDANIEALGDIKIDESKVSLQRNENFDKFLEENAKIKAEEMLEKLIEEKKKDEQNFTQMQKQMMQLYMMQNGYLQYFPTFNPYYAPPLIKQEQERPASYDVSIRESSSHSGQVKLQ